MLVTDVLEQWQDFEEVTKNSFLHALAEHNVQIQDEHIELVLRAYDDLKAFDDVIPALNKIEAASNMDCVVFSNGTRKMIVNSVNNSKGLSTKANVFSRLISVDHVQSFKPAPEAYRYLRNCVEGSGLTGDLYLVSSNPFDIVGARSIGMQAVWVDRTGRGWIDKLGKEPTLIVQDLGQLVEAMLTA